MKMLIAINETGMKNLEIVEKKTNPSNLNLTQEII